MSIAQYTFRLVNDNYVLGPVSNAAGSPWVQDRMSAKSKVQYNNLRLVKRSAKDSDHRVLFLAAPTAALDIAGHCWGRLPFPTTTFSSQTGVRGDGDSSVVRAPDS